MQEDYYTSTRSRILDTIVGIGLIWIVNTIIVLICGGVIYLISLAWSGSTSDTNQVIVFISFILSIVSLIAIIIVDIVSIIFFFKNNRRYISIGEIIGLSLICITPLLFYGACIIVFVGVGMTSN